LRSYRASLEISERLAAVDPENAGWQHDLASSLVQIGSVLREKGDRASAIENYTAAQEIISSLVAQNEEHPQWTAALAWLKAQLEELAAED
jgi:hypothetical protein